VDKLPDKREILIEQIRELKKDVIVVPNEAKKKAYIIYNADSMNANAQNAFLQILEEPPAHAVFILCTENSIALLPTVRSRCIDIKAGKEADTSGSVAADTSDIADAFLKALECGNAALTAFMFRLDKLDKNAFSAFLAAARGLVAARLRAAASGGIETTNDLFSRTERILVKAGEMLDLNVSPVHISGMICASLLAVKD
jgi:hypothetical protein